MNKKLNLRMFKNISKLNLIRNQLSKSIRKSSNNTDHLYGVEQVQYLTIKKKPVIKQESDNVAFLEDDDMLSVYLTKKVKRTKTTEDKPIYVPSWEKTRVICCHCDLEGLDLNYTILEKNKVTKCECGYHYKLVDQLDPFSRIN